MLIVGYRRPSGSRIPDQPVRCRPPHLQAGRRSRESRSASGRKRSKTASKPPVRTDEYANYGADRPKPLRSSVTGSRACRPHASSLDSQNVSGECQRQHPGQNRSPVGQIILPVRSPLGELAPMIGSSSPILRPLCRRIRHAAPSPKPVAHHSACRPQIAHGPKRRCRSSHR